MPGMPPSGFYRIILKYTTPHSYMGARGWIFHISHSMGIFCIPSRMWLRLWLWLWLQQRLQQQLRLLVFPSKSQRGRHAEHAALWLLRNQPEADKAPSLLNEGGAL